MAQHSIHHTVAFGGLFLVHCHFFTESLGTSLHTTQICVLTSLVLKFFGISKNVNHVRSPRLS